MIYPLCWFFGLVPVYDCTEFDLFAKGNLPPVNAPRFEGEIPLHSTVVVGHTVNKYVKPGVDGKPQVNISLNILWVAILAMDQ